MKFNIVAISPAGATLTFFDVELLRPMKQPGGGVYAVFQKKKDKDPIGLIPTCWAVNIKSVEAPSATQFIPFLIPPQNTGKP